MRKQVHPDDIGFSTMAVSQRNRALVVLSESLRRSAERSHALKSRHWQKLEKIAHRIVRDHEELANDRSEKSVRFVSDAAHALDEFAKETASYDHHPAARISLAR